MASGLRNVRQTKHRLRDYQRECLDAILARYRAGVRRQLVCLPTGTGKTVIFAHFPGFFRMKKRMLVLAHREELLDQARDKILVANPRLTVEVEQAGRKASPHSDVVVASIPTLGRTNSKRLARLDPEEFYLVVVDEAHHSTAETYRRVLDHFGVLAEDTRKLLVGFTATPKRGDGQGLDTVFQEITFSRSLPEMILAGHLSPVAAFRVETDVDLSGVRTRMGDFVTSHLSRAVNVQGRNDLVVKVFREHLVGRQTICFCVDVAHARSLAKSFRRANIPTAAVTGEMDPDRRRKALVEFRAGRVRVLTNCMVLTEGYDEPSVAGVILARPTRSTLLYTQMIGRGTRLHPGKENVTVVDIVDATKDHSLVTLPGLFGLTDDFDLEGRTTTRIQEALEWVEKNRPWVRTELATSLSDLRYRCRQINLLELDLPAELCGCARFAWTRIGKDAYRLGLAENETVFVTPTILGEWEIVARGRPSIHSGRPRRELVERRGRRVVGRPGVGGSETRIGDAKAVPEAVRLAEAWVETKRRDSLGLVILDTRWRREPASEKQKRLLKTRGIKVPRGIRKGQASHLIAMLSKGRGSG